MMDPNKITDRIMLIFAILFISSFGYCQYDQYRELNACINRGVDYFSSIGSWPALRDGREAATVAKERCQRTPTAF